MTIPLSCVGADGAFLYGIHQPDYRVTNLRPPREPYFLGRTTKEQLVDNRGNFPSGDLRVAEADWIFEIPNAFPFRGRTFITRSWADAAAGDPRRISLAPREEVSLTKTLAKTGVAATLHQHLPRPLLLALATCSTDPADLTRLAQQSCEFIFAGETPIGLCYSEDRSKKFQPLIKDHPLFEAVANNPHTPAPYKIAMVIRPGAQGGSEIVGEWLDQPSGSHAYEYLRRNSYIAGGHYAANMAEDAIRYDIVSLSADDLRGLRHLYYQRTFVRLAEQLGLTLPATARLLDEAELESLRQAILKLIQQNDFPPGKPYPATLWGWNFGFDFAPSLYRLHASHQQIHQQYAMIPGEIGLYRGGMTEAVGTMVAYSCGDQIAAWIREYQRLGHGDFFVNYRRAIAGNRRMDGRRDLSADLVVWADRQVMLFVPKGQTSAWELQLMTLPDSAGRVPGNVVECGPEVRRSLDTALLKAQQALAGLGARMVSTIEYPKRLGTSEGPAQALLYAFLPRLPEAPGAFSEAQLRWINGHYPEDFAAACRNALGL